MTIDIIWLAIGVLYLLAVIFLWSILKLDRRKKDKGKLSDYMGEHWEDHDD